MDIGIKLRILHVSPELDGGGVDRLLYDYSVRMQGCADIDFVVTSDTEGILEAPLEDHGFAVRHIPQIRVDLAGHKRQLREIISKNRYDIIHDHRGYRAYFSLKIAEEEGVPVRIAHSHIATIPETIAQGCERLLFTALTKHHATDLYACGQLAASWMWGQRAVDSESVRIMPNAIDTTTFAFDSRVRKEVRDELSLGDGLVIGNVARFANQKNHRLLIDIFFDVQKLIPNSKLVLVGRGELESDVRSQVSRLGIDDKVVFLGVRNDVPRLLNAMDVFVMPSLYEGLPVTIVEAQANGLPVLASSTITDEVFFDGPVERLGLDELPSRWAERAIDFGRRRHERGGFPVSPLLLDNFEIDRAASRQLAWYESAARRCSD